MALPSSDHDQLRPAGRGRRQHVLGLGLAAAIAVTLVTRPAAADLKVCNYTDSRIGVTLGYRHQNEWVTEGWWNVLSHACETLIPGELNGRFYYIYGVDYDRGGAWEGKSGSHEMCIDDKSFTIKKIGDCQSRGFKSARFLEIDTGDAKDYTIRLTDPTRQGAGTE